ncbi:MAG: hypothetical protein IJ736_04380, partial [Firmicutes bacterium]|nr:hypothetical protein [Bacillota bacterium]
MIFLLVLVLGFIFPEVIYRIVNKNIKENKNDTIKRIAIRGAASAAVSLLLSYLYVDKSDFSQYMAMIITCLCISILTEAIYGKIKEKKYNIYQSLFFILSLTILLELFVFNMRRFDTVSVRNDVFSLKDSFIDDIDEKLKLENIELKSDGTAKVINNEDAIITFKMPEKKIKSVKVDFKRKNYDISTVYIKSYDSGNALGAKYSDRLVKDDILSSKYISISPAGNVKELQIAFVNFGSGEEFKINDIVFNETRPIDIYPLRMVIVFAFILILFIMREKCSYKDIVCNEKSYWQRLGVLIFAILQLSFMYWTATSAAGEKLNNFNEDQYNELANAIEKGQVYLDGEPPEELIEMENPYDYNNRIQTMNDAGKSTKWDHVYYNGKYYAYFGIAPVLLLYLPAKIIFNKVLMGYEALFTLSFILLIGTIMLFSGIRRVWFKNKLPYIVYLLLMILFINSTGIIYCLRDPKFYQIAASASVAFSVLGFAFLVNSMTAKKDLSRRIYLFFGAFFLACVAASRPDVLLFSIAAIPMLWNKIFSGIIKKNKYAIIDTVIFIIPYAVIGAGLMYYNYIRFGSVTDFGNNYQLTICDMRYASDIGKLPLGLWIMYLQPPVIRNVFPFINKVVYHVAYQGYFYIDSTLGTIFMNIILLFIFGVFRLKNKENADKKGMFGMCVSFALIGFIVSMIIIVVGGLH